MGGVSEHVSALDTVEAAALERPVATMQEADAREWVQRVYRRQFDFVWRTLRGLGVSEAQVDDAVQDVFIVVYRRRHDFRPDSSEKAWLFQIARYVAGNHRRTRRRKGDLVPLSDESPAVATLPPDEQAARNEASALLMQFLEMLNDEQRDVFVLMELTGASAREASEALNAKANTIYSRLRLARQRWDEFVGAHAARMAEDHDG